MIKTRNPFKLTGAGIIVVVMTGYMLFYIAKSLVNTGTVWNEE